MEHHHPSIPLPTLSRATIALHLEEAARALIEVGRHIDAVRVHLADQDRGFIQVPVDVSLKEAVRMIVLQVLQQEGGHRTRTARRLRISRRTVVSIVVAEKAKMDKGEAT